MSVPAARFALRDLPLPAKLVVTCFLLAVGVGYTTALVQLHFQDSKSGKPMPTVEDVILKFTGKKFLETDPPRAPSKFVKLITAPPGLPFSGIGTMSPAFTTRDGGEFARALREAPHLRDKIIAERDGERDILVVWAESAPEVRKAAYEADRFDPEAGKEPKAITDEFHIAGGGYKVKKIIEARCVRCHAKGEPQENYPLETYAQVEKYLAAPAAVTVGPKGGWAKVEEPIGLEKLTQSTHAHLLSFAVLFSLTGLTFAFTSYPTVVRCVLGPWALVAICTDVAFWWLARLSDGYGVYFAMGVIGTGGAAGMGLSAQILLSLWNMYGPKGKVVLLGVLGLGAAAGGLVMFAVVKPGLEAKQQELRAAKAEKPADEGKRADEPPKTEPKKAVAGDPPPIPLAKAEGPAGKDPVAPSRLEELLQFPLVDNKETRVLDLKWSKEAPGGMVRAFFDKDAAEFKDAVKEKDEDAQKKLTPPRHAEREALLVWARLPDAERKRAYVADEFPLPEELAKRADGEFVAAGKARIKALLTARCLRCHEGDVDEEFKFGDYDTLRRYLDPAPAGK
jgi:cytochrome c5